MPKEVSGLAYTKGKIWLDVYIQYSNTDTDRFVLYTDFVKPGQFRGSVEYSDYYDCKQTSYYIYGENDKAKVVKSILLEYVYDKYKDKLA